MLNLLNMIYMNTEKTKILSTEKITKEMALNEISGTDLTQEEIDKYLEIIFAINHGQQVYNLTTNNGDFLVYCKK